MLYIIEVFLAFLVLFIICTTSGSPLFGVLNADEIVSPVVFNAKVDKVFNIGALFPHSYKVTEHVIFEGIYEDLALTCAIDTVNNDSSILPYVTLAYQIRDLGDSGGQAIAASISLVASQDVIVTLGILVVF